MEFERSIFRVHDRMMRGNSSQKLFTILVRVFSVFTVTSLCNFLIFHNLYVDKNDILKSAIEQQMKPYFYEKLGAPEGQTFSLNYTEDSGQFIFDNSTQAEKYSQVRDIFGIETLSSNASLNNNYTQNVTNIGIRSEDIFLFLIVKTQEYANILRD